MRGQEAFALLMAMRTGKTKTVIDDFGRLEAEGKCQDLMVIAPGGVYKTWQKALIDHLPGSLLERTSLHTWVSGAGKRQEKWIAEFLGTTGPRVLLMNVEALSTVARARELAKFFLGNRKTMLVIDESTAIKNHRAKRTKFVIKELKPLADYRRILSGLPSPKSPIDLYSQFEFLDQKILGHSSFFSFRNQYAVIHEMVINGRRVPIIVGHKNEEELQAKIKPHSHRVLLEDCYDLPPKIYQTREVPLTEEQERIYKSLKDFATAELENEEHVTATQVITQILRLHQVLCGHVGTEQGEFREIPERRTETLIDLLEEHDGKGIIWCSYDADVRKVANAIDKSLGAHDYVPHNPKAPLEHVARFWGGNRSSREDEERRFLTDPECRYMVATAAAGGRGRTWTVADLVVYYSNTADLEHRAQSEERAQGIDKKNSVLYVDLVAPGTVDVKMLRTLRDKMTMAATITGDKWREWLL